MLCYVYVVGAVRICLGFVEGVLLFVVRVLCGEWMCCCGMLVVLWFVVCADVIVLLFVCVCFCVLLCAAMSV